MPQYPAGSAPSAWIIENERTREVEIWSLTTSERHRRLLARAGCESIRSLDASEEPGDPQAPSVMIVRSDAILDERLVKGLFAASNTILVANRKQHTGWGGAVAAHVDCEHAAEALRLTAGDLTVNVQSGLPFWGPYSSPREGFSAPSCTCP